MDRDDEYTQPGFAAVSNLKLNTVMDLLLRYNASLSAAGGAIVNVGNLASFLALRLACCVLYHGSEYRD